MISEYPCITAYICILHTLVYQINVAPRLFILKKKSQLHALIWYSMLINIWGKTQKKSILLNLRGQFWRKWTYLKLHDYLDFEYYKSPCFFNSPRLFGRLEYICKAASLLDKGRDVNTFKPKCITVKSQLVAVGTINI